MRLPERQLPAIAIVRRSTHSPIALDWQPFRLKLLHAASKNRLFQKPSNSSDLLKRTSLSGYAISDR